jgi:hypothetical protein
LKLYTAHGRILYGHNHHPYDNSDSAVFTNNSTRSRYLNPLWT